MPDFLTKKMGPLPMGVWLIVIAAGLFLGFRINKGQGQAPADTGSGIDSEVGRGGTGLTPVEPSLPNDQPSGITNNEQWRVSAINFLVGLGNEATVVNRAVQRFLDGETLSVRENAMIGLAIARFGPPPEGARTPDVPVEPPAPTPSVTVSAPATVKAGRPFRVSGTGLFDGKPGFGVVQIFLLRSDGVYRAHDTSAVANGKWDSILPGGMKGSSKKYEARVYSPTSIFAPRSGKVAKSSFTVKFV